MLRLLALSSVLAPLALAASLDPALTPAPDPADELGALTPTVVVVTDVALDFTGEGERVDLVLAGGRIRSVAPTGGGLPPGARPVDGAGLVARPAFLDAWSFHGCETPAPRAEQDHPVETRGDVRAAMRDANRKGIQPGFHAADVLDLGADGAGAWRQQGFGALLVAPTDELLAGRGTVIATRQGPVRDLVLSPEVFQHGTFAASGRGFPSTLMGYFAQLRQFFYDVQHQADLRQRYGLGRPDPRPAWDPDLEAALRLVEGRELYVVHADRASDIERWLRLADEFDLRLAIAGGRGAWRHADLLAERGVPVFLDLDWGEEVDDPTPDRATDLTDSPDEPGGAGSGADLAAAEVDEPADPADADAGTDEEPTADDAGDAWHYLEPLGVREERRRRWEETRAGALVLEAAGVPVFYGTGDRQPKELLAGLRELVELGADPAVLHRRLTADAANFLGLGDHLGELTVGRDASLALWTADPLDPDAAGQLAWLFVDGMAHEFDVDPPGEGPAEGVDATGTWDLNIDGDMAPEDATASLSMDEGGAVTGTYRFVAAWNGEAYEAAVSGRVDGTSLTVKGRIEFGDGGMDVTFAGELEGQAFSGKATTTSDWGDDEATVTGARRPEHRHDHHEADEDYTCHH